MATVRKRGNTYQIRISAGYDRTGKQIIKSVTWKPDPGMTEKQIQKELDRQKVLFEEQCRTGQFLDGNITLSDFAEKWFQEYAEKNLRTRTVSRYKELSERILQALGHIRLARLQPFHLIEFYNFLGADGVRLDQKYRSCVDLKAMILAQGTSVKEFAKLIGISDSTLRSAVNGNNVSRHTADAVAAALARPDIFVSAEKTKLSAKTISEYHALISSMLSTAVQWQIIPSNPCARVKPPRYEPTEAQSLDPDQSARLINCLQSAPLKFRTAVLLTMYTGMRRGELCGLEWSDVDFSEGQVHINKSVLYSKEVGVFEDTTKNKSSKRSVSIPSDMIRLLKEYKSEQLAERLLLGDLWQGSNKIFTSQYGGIINPNTISRWFKTFIRRNKFPDIHLHSLRHTSATLLISEGVDIATVSKRLGHSNKTTTLNVYAHAIKAADKAAADKLQDLFNRRAN